MNQTALNPNHAVPIVVERHGRQLNLTVTPQLDPKEGMGVGGWAGEQNVQIGEILNGSGAQAAGLQPGDLFMTVNGQPVVSAVTVQQAVIHSGRQTS